MFSHCDRRSASNDRGEDKSDGIAKRKWRNVSYDPLSHSPGSIMWEINEEN